MKIIGFHLEESKRNKGAMLLIATDEEGDRWVIGGNVEALAKWLNRKLNRITKLKN